MIAGRLEDGALADIWVFVFQDSRVYPVKVSQRKAFFLGCNTSRITYIIGLHLDVSVCLAQSSETHYPRTVSRASNSFFLAMGFGVFQITLTFHGSLAARAVGIH